MRFKISFCHGLKIFQFTEAKWRLYASVKHSTIGSDNGLSPVRQQTISRTNATALSIRPQVTYFTEMLSKIQKFSSTTIYLTMPSAK